MSGAPAKKKDPKAEAKAAEEKKKADAKAKEEKSLTSANLALLKAGLPNKVVVHPLVLLSVVDHYARTAADGAVGKRAVGILLGEVFQGKVDITNSYAVPFEEDVKDPTVWFLDHNYHEDMFAMFKKVNAKEKVVGWYSTGPKIRPADLEINELIRKYTSNPVLAIIDVNPQDELEIPTEAYISVENVPEQQSTGRRTFVHLPSEIGAYEAEEVGVEHLLRNIRDNTVGTVSDQVNAKLNALKGLKKRMQEMYTYLDAVCKGDMPLNHQIIYNLQDMFNLTPDLKVEQLVKAFAVKTNDNMLALYVGSLIRSIIALHDLINNKLANRQLEVEKRQKEVADKEAKEKEAKDKEAAAAKEKAAEKGKDGRGAAGAGADAAKDAKKDA